MMQLLLIHARDQAEAAAIFGDVLRDSFDIAATDGHGDVPSRIDAVVLLWTKGLHPFPARLDRVVLDAWEEDRLLVIALDASARPVGLRDLPAIDTRLYPNALTDSAVALRQAVMIGMRDDFPRYVRDRVDPPDVVGAAQAHSSTTMSEGAWNPGVPAARGGGMLGVAIVVLIFGGILLGGGMWLTSVEIGQDVLLAALGLAVLYIVVRLVRAAPELWEAWRGSRRSTVKTQTVATKPVVPPSGPKPSDVFVSYAHADTPVVDQVIAAVADAGKEIWIDRRALRSGDSWAGEIVRAIKGTRGVLVMCSARAFGSDHVKREVYLADKCKKPIVPIFVERVEPPDDFEYFLAGVQRLDWYNAPPDARQAAVKAAMAQL